MKNELFLCNPDLSTSHKPGSCIHIEDNFDGITINLKETNSIKIPGKPEYVLKQQGFKKAVVWVGKNPETKEIDQTYVCIEPVEEDPFGDFFGSEGSLIMPGESRVVLLKLCNS